MHLIYLDESGNTGLDLSNAPQPVFVLGALVVPEADWITLETELTSLVEKFFPSPRPNDFELHATELINPRGYFRQYSITHRLDFFREALQAAARLRLRFIYRAIVKKRFGAWLENTFGPGVIIDPHVAAFALAAQVVHEYLKSLPGRPQGIFISDDNKEVALDVEKSIRFCGETAAAFVLGKSLRRAFSLIRDPVCPFNDATFACMQPGGWWKQKADLKSNLWTRSAFLG